MRPFRSPRSPVPRSRKRPVLGAVILVFVLAVPGAPGTAGANPRSAREEAALGLVPPTPDGQLPLLIETDQAASLASRIEELGGRVTYVYENIGGLAATLPREAIAALLGDGRVESARRQRIVRRAVASWPFPEPRSGTGLRRRPPEGEIHVPPGDGPRVRSLSLGELVREGARRDSEPVSFFGYDLLTGAADSWVETGFGEGVIVAIIDTGIFPGHPMYVGNVIGGENLVPAEEEQQIDADGDGLPDGHSFDWDAIENHGHGTFVAGLVAGHAELTFTEDDPLVASVAFHSPESVDFDGQGGAIVRLMGTAPGASLYGLKVFPYDGSGAPDARIIEAIDRILTKKQQGVLDTDVINMSLSGPVLFDGRNPLDRIVDVATVRGVTVVSAASNDGPALTTVGSPASAFTGLAAGGVLDPLHTRVAFELFSQAPPGTGNVLLPSDDLHVVDFSSRGLTGDHRVKPSLVATALLLFSSALLDLDQNGLNDTPVFGFGSGTSFSTPTVAGAAALVTAFGDRLGQFARAPFVANALLRSAIPIAPFLEVSQREQGRGFVHIPGALALMEAGEVHHEGLWNREHPRKEQLVLGDAVGGATPDLAPGRTFTFLIEVPPGIARIDFEFPQVTTGETWNPIFGELMEASLHSAKRGGTGDYIFFASQGITPGTTFEYLDPEPGILRLTMAAFPTNYSPISASFRANALYGAPSPVVHHLAGLLARDEIATHVLDVPAGLQGLAVRLGWKHDWTRWPTYDLDLFVEGSLGVGFAAASLDSPELLWIDSPSSGPWKFTVADIGTVRQREPYWLDVALVRRPWRLRQAIADLDHPRLFEASPNPVRDFTDVSFSVPKAERVRMSVYDVAGRLVRTLLDDRLEFGEHRVRWDGRSEAGVRSAAGVYFLRLETEAGATTRKVTILK